MALSACKAFSLGTDFQAFMRFGCWSCAAPAGLAEEERVLDIEVEVPQAGERRRELVVGLPALSEPKLRSEPAAADGGARLLGSSANAGAHKLASSCPRQSPSSESLSTCEESQTHSPRSGEASPDDAHEEASGRSTHSSKSSTETSTGGHNGDDNPRHHDGHGVEVQPSDQDGVTVSESLAAAFSAKDLEVPKSEQPLFTRHLPGVELSRLAGALLEDSGDALMPTFLREAFKAQDLSVGAWSVCRGAPGAMVQTFRYHVPLPKDVPEFLIKMLGLKPLVSNSTVSCISCTSERVLLVQDSQAEGAMYSDRFQMRHIHCFTASQRGGVDWRSWTIVTWPRPLPWTHTFIAKIIESKVRSEASGSATAFARLAAALPAGSTVR